MNPEQDLKAIFLKAVTSVDPFTLITGLVKKEGPMLSIGRAGLDTAPPVNICIPGISPSPLSSSLTEDLSRYEEIVILGVGKASCRMAQAMERVMGESIVRGAVVTKYGQALPLERIHIVEAGHPVPDEQSMEGARILMQSARKAGSRSLVINLISGGGSALACLPAAGTSLEDKQKTTKLLLASGANINEVNCVRKHLSRIKGGNLAKAAWPARMINLILSDVVGDPLDTIASGMTVPDSTTFRQAMEILEKYNLQDSVPESVRQTMESGIRGDLPETPKAGDPYFANVENILIGNNRTACTAAEEYGKALGYHTRKLNEPVTGEAREAASLFISLADDIDSGKAGLKKPALIVAGGETTVTIRGPGTGGRNQEMALAFACRLLETRQDGKNVFFLSAGTDGIDGPTDAAGAMITPALNGIIRDQGIDPSRYLDNNDSNQFFEKTGHLIKTGPTGTNVCDIQLLIVK